MLQVHAFETDIENQPQPVVWADKRFGNRLDCETAALLRQVVAPIFASARSWQGLRRSLRARGYDFVFEAGRLVLIGTQHGEKICSCRFLGHPLASLAARFGRLRARPPQPRGRYGQAML